jgi:diguanylate cyclase (GGDEF)-like protein
MATNRILVADDDPVLTRVLELTLQSWGWETIACGDAQSAWQALSGPDAPRMAILDWVLPDLDGLELCRRIRAQEDVPYIYLIVLTGKSARGDLLKGMEAGADDYLTKPCDLEELRMRVRAGQRIIDLQAKLLETQEELQRQATHDMLTEIWNRRAIMDILEREVERARRAGHTLSVIMADVDHFKSINDTYGHLTGDRVLYEVAQNIKTCLRAYDAVGRYGGEEFLMVLPDCSAASAGEIAERIRCSLAKQPIAAASATVPVTISLGVSASKIESAMDETEGQTLIASADAALYEAKKQGRNRVVPSLRSPHHEESAVD